VLAAQGAEVRVIIPPWDDAERAGERSSATAEALAPTVIHTRLGPAPLQPAVVLWDILRELRAFQPDVVHAFKPIGYSGAIARRLASGSGHRPLVVVDADDLEGPEGWGHRRRLRLGGLLRGSQERRTLRTADSVTVASHWLEGYVQSLNVRAPHVLYLPNGHEVTSEPATTSPDAAQTGSAAVTPPGPTADASGAKRTERGTDTGEGPADPPSDSAVRLLWYTRFTEASPDRGARLLGPVLRAHPSLRLTVLGDELGAGDQASLRATLGQEGVGSQVDWLGYEAALAGNVLDLGTSGAVAIYPLDDDLVNRARCPSKIPQLMALGTPLVVESVGEAAQYLAAFEAECLVRPGDAAAFGARIERLLLDRDARRSLSERLQEAADRWRWSQVAAGLMSWYSGQLPARVL
jgi:glycosyltransferase involved in cell wall biosynthesis